LAWKFLWEQIKNTAMLDENSSNVTILSLEVTKDKTAILFEKRVKARRSMMFALVFPWPPPGKYWK